MTERSSTARLPNGAEVSFHEDGDDCIEIYVAGRYFSCAEKNEVAMGDDEMWLEVLRDLGLRAEEDYHPQTATTPSSEGR